MGRVKEDERNKKNKRLCMSTIRKSQRRKMKKIRSGSAKSADPLAPSGEPMAQEVNFLNITERNTSPMEYDDIEIEYESITGENSQQKNEIQGRRIVNVEHLFKQILNGQKHEPFDCSVINMKLINEKRNGLFSKFYLRCEMCHCVKTITSDNKTDNKMNVNSSLILGSISTGIGYSQVNELASTLNMPLMSGNTCNKYHEQVADFIRVSAWQKMEEAAAEEAKLARNIGDIDVNGIPYITVVTDGAWGKRSYNVNYDSMSGVASIIGYKTGKILFLGVRNKYCSLCSWHENRRQEIPEHKCFKNWTGTSTAMETDIIAEGFKSSVKQYGLVYKKMVGDGDSSVFRRLLEIKPYGNSLVQKVECKNHLLRNLAKKIREICNKKRSNSKNAPVPIALRKNVLSKFMRIRSAITKAAEFRIKEATTLERKIELLKGDIKNAPSHVFGEHKECKAIEYFKCEGTGEDLVPTMKQCGIYEDVMAALQRVIDNSYSLIMNMDNNLAEHYNSVVCKFIGGKRVNFSLKGSYQTRCEAAALSFNSGEEYHRIINKSIFGNSPASIRSITKKKLKRKQKSRPRKFYFQKR